MNKDAEYPTRKPNRLKGYSYSQNGIYFLTVCTKDNKCILGRIVGDGDPDVPQMLLSEYGKITEKYIQSVKQAYKHIAVMNYVIMPNHLHLIVMIYSDNNIFRESHTDNPANDDIPVMISALKKLINKEIGSDIWQRSYHDHVIRNEASFQNIWDYVEANPARWKKDCFYCD